MIDSDDFGSMKDGKLTVSNLKYVFVCEHYNLCIGRVFTCVHTSNSYVHTHIHAHTCTHADVRYLFLLPTQSSISAQYSTVVTGTVLWLI